MAAHEHTQRASNSLPTRVAGLLFSVMALGELGVGFVVLVFPSSVSEVLLGAPLEGVGAVVARMAGIAIAALGLTWWLTRSDLDKRPNAVAPGFIGYNLGVGLLFLAYALSTTRPVPLAWLVAIVHLLGGVAFCAAILVRRSVT